VCGLCLYKKVLAFHLLGVCYATFLTFIKHLSLIDLVHRSQVCRKKYRKQIFGVLFQTNTFQAVLVTDGQLSFVTLNYGVLEWTRSGQVAVCKKQCVFLLSTSRP